MIDLDEIEKACAEATLGPWHFIDNGWGEETILSANTGAGDVCALPIGSHSDTVFIAGARSWVPALVAEVRRLRAELDAMEEEHGCCSGAGLLEAKAAHAAAVRARGE